MTSPPKKRCIYQGCPYLAVPGNARCLIHIRSKRPWVKNRPSGGSGGYGRGWGKRRAQVLKEEPECRWCGAPSTEVDHIINKAEGGTDHRANLQGMCHRCHTIKTHQESARGVARARQLHRTVAP